MGRILHDWTSLYQKVQDICAKKMYSLVHMNAAKRYPRIESLIKWLKVTPVAEARAQCLAQHTTWEYLRQIAYGYKLVGPRRGVAIERATGVPRRELRPHDYWLAWPDLPEPSDQEHTGEAELKRFP
jgi:DNA-binding transcriptional regulator YdaS (Cro superfamily)